MSEQPTRKIEVELTEDEIIVLQYILSTNDSTWGDPLKDIYEIGPRASEDDFEPYESLKTMAPKMYKALAKPE